MTHDLKARLEEVYRLAEQKEDIKSMIFCITEAVKYNIGLNPGPVPSANEEPSAQDEPTDEYESEQDVDIYENPESWVSVESIQVPYHEIKPYMQYNDLTADEAERLFLLSEELGEAVQSIGKILRHGYESFSPFDEEQTTNRESLERELGDIAYAVDLLLKNQDINQEIINEYFIAKSENIQDYLHHQDGEEE